MRESYGFLFIFSILCLLVHTVIPHRHMPQSNEPVQPLRLHHVFPWECEKWVDAAMLCKRKVLALTGLGPVQAPIPLILLSSGFTKTSITGIHLGGKDEGFYEQNWPAPHTSTSLPHQPELTVSGKQHTAQPGDGYIPLEAPPRLCAAETPFSVCDYKESGFLKWRL